MTRNTRLGTTLRVGGSLTLALPDGRAVEVTVRSVTRTAVRFWVKAPADVRVSRSQPEIQAVASADDDEGDFPLVA